METSADCSETYESFSGQYFDTWKKGREQVKCDEMDVWKTRLENERAGTGKLLSDDQWTGGIFLHDDDGGSALGVAIPQIRSTSSETNPSLICFAVP